MQPSLADDRPPLPASPPASPEIAPLNSLMFADSNAESGQSSGDHYATGSQHSHNAAVTVAPSDPATLPILPPRDVALQPAPPQSDAGADPRPQRHVVAASLTADERLIQLAARPHSEGQSHMPVQWNPFQLAHLLAPMVPVQLPQPVSMAHQRQHNVQLVQQTVPVASDAALSVLRTSAIATDNDAKVKKPRKPYRTKKMREQEEANALLQASSGLMPQQYATSGLGQVVPRPCVTSPRAMTPCCLVVVSIGAMGGSRCRM
jgi:hypothetical protein